MYVIKSLKVWDHDVSQAYLHSFEIFERMVYSIPESKSLYALCMVTHTRMDTGTSLWKNMLRQT